MAEGRAAPVSDRALVVGFQRGDEQAYDEIFKRYHSRVAGICQRMLGSTQDAEEATQETFLKAYVALGRFNGSYYLGAWLGRIATNVCVDHLRSRSRSNLVALPEDRDDLLTEVGPEDLVVGSHPRLHEAIREIQPLHASALALRAVEGMSHQEIAGRLQMSPAQVKALLHRARNSLRRAWDKAEGWALAPLLSIRHMASRGDDADRLASVSPSAAPFIMEKVAASAMIVAAALTGLPSAPPDADVATDGGRVPTVTTGRIQQQERRAIAAVHPGASVRAIAARMTRTGAADTPKPDEVSAVLAEVDKALATPKEAAPQDRPRGYEDEESNPLGPHAAEGDRLKKKVQKAVRHIEETLAP